MHVPSTRTLPNADPDSPVNSKTVVNGQVTLVEYDPAWPATFRTEEARIRGALGDRAIQIHHIGSTAVPGLIAKPCIDILLVVDDAGADDAYVPDLERVGYVLRISEIDDSGPHRVFKGSEINLNLHVWSAGSPRIARHLDFCDWLRGHPEDRERYADARRKLARQEWQFMQDYADAKDDVVQEITTRIKQAQQG